MSQSVAITSPAPGATVSGTVVIEVAAVSVGQVNFFVDNHYLGDDASAPFSWSLDTTKLADGLHTITAESANGAVHAQETITVANNAPAPTPPPPPSPGPTPVPVGALIFGDEFDGPAGPPDSTKWTARTGGSNGAAHYNGLHNVALDGNGHLVITEAKDSGGVWQSAFLSTGGKKGYSGPRYCECLAKMAPGAGTWSAPLWEWPYPWGAAPGIENDVNEQLGKDPLGYHFTWHNWNGGSSPQKGQRIACGVDLSQGFHRYGCAVYADHADCYFDGQKVGVPVHASDIGLASLTAHEVAAVIDLNIGGWGGAISVAGPVKMFVDYVRIYALA